jgi:hypothetical protein
MSSGLRGKVKAKVEVEPRMKAEGKGKVEAKIEVEAVDQEPKTKN